MADPIEPLVQECATCGTLIDVTEEDPFALMHCPNCGEAMRVRRAFGKFELLEILGAGGMGAVYRAMDSTLGRSVALKLLRKEYTENAEFVRKFEHEAAITAQINHPNVVKVFSTGSSHGLFYIAMELVDKGSLDDLMTLQSRVAEAQVLEVGIQIAHGLNAALQRGLIHRDVKPGNILFADAHHAKIVDFGLAHPMGQAPVQGEEIWGTPYYVAPEKLESPPTEDLRSDIYSLGATLFHAVAGRPPYEAEDASMVALKHLKSQPVSLQAFAPDVHTATSYVINRTLNKDPEERYPSYEELIAHLEYARDEVLAASSQPKNQNRLILEDEHSQRMMSWVTIGILSVLLLGGLGIFLFRDAIFGKEKAGPQTVAEHERDASSQIEPRCQAARMLLASGKSAEAAAEFEKLDTETPEPPQPLRNWITLQAALCQTLGGHMQAARADLQKIASRGPYSFDPAEEKLATFFLNVSEKAANANLEPASVAKDYAKNNFEAIALLLFAAKDWQLGDVEDAGPLFRQFHSASPEAPYNWMTSYRDVASRYIDGYTLYREIPERIKGAATLDEQKAIIPKLRETLQRLPTLGPLAPKAEAMVRDFEKQVNDREEVVNRQRSEQEAADAAALKAAKEKIDTLCAQFKFAEAKAAISAASITGLETMREKDVLEKRMKWLAQFKALLIGELPTAGYPGPLATKTGQISGTVIRANESQLDVKTPYGAVPVKWTDLTPDCIFLLGRATLRSTLQPEALADREWALGVYCIYVGKTREGRALLQDAAKNNPSYREELSIFPEATEPA